MVLKLLEWVITPISIMGGIMYSEWVPNPIVNHNLKYWFASILECRNTSGFIEQPTMYKVCIVTVNMGDQPHCQTLIDMLCEMEAQSHFEPDNKFCVWRVASSTFTMLNVRKTTINEWAMMMGEIMVH